MAIYKSEAIILRSRKQGETSKLLTLYTRNFGLIKVIAKGSRSLKSHYWGVLELFNHIDMVYYHKESRELQFLSQASILTCFKSIQELLGKMAIAANLCELVEKAEIQGSANPFLFKLLLEFLTVLDKAPAGWRNLLRGSLLKYLELSGFRPALDHCEVCHNDQIAEQNYFIFQNGGYTCGRCAWKSGAGVVLTGDTIKLLRWLQKTAIESQNSARIPQSVGSQADRFIYSYAAYHLEGTENLRSAKFLFKYQPKTGDKKHL